MYFTHLSILIFNNSSMGFDIPYSPYAPSKKGFEAHIDPLFKNLMILIEESLS